MPIFGFGSNPSRRSVRVRGLRGQALRGRTRNQSRYIWE